MGTIHLLNIQTRGLVIYFFDDRSLSRLSLLSNGTFLWKNYFMKTFGTF